MKKILLIGLLAVFPAGALWAAAPEAVFIHVQGKVTVKAAKGQKTRAAKAGGRVREGETVTTAGKALASLRLFDGSEIDLKPGTSVTLSRLRRPSALQKIIRFKLAFGDLLAKVKKLLTPTSSFEVSAGGVVCGVRGTEFEVSCDPDTHHVDLHVFEGTVYTRYNGHTVDYKAGQNAHFPPRQLGGGSGNSPNTGLPVLNGRGSLALEDLDRQFNLGLGFNGDNGFTDPSVAGSIRLQVQVNVNPVETVP